MKNFADFMFETKLGHFLFILAFGTAFSVLTAPFVALILEIAYTQAFFASEAGVVFASAFICITDDNKRWL